MALPFSQIPSEMMREVRRRKWFALLVFVVVCIIALLVGYLWHYKYESQVVIFVDDSNIIGPLMEGNAVTTKISDRASAAEQLIDSRDLLSKVAQDPSIWGPGATKLSQQELEKRMDKMRKDISVRPLGKRYFGITYTGHQQQRVFRIAQRLGQLFITNSESRKKEESRSAYNFIDKQVKAYEHQLQEAQNNLKQFETKNTDGTEDQENKKIADIRGKIELAKLDLEQAQAQSRSLKKQIKGVGQTVNQGQTEDMYAQRINKLQQQLDNLRLQYKESYPDIVNLKHQIAELEKEHKEAQKNRSADQITQGQQVINPLYQTLRSQLASANATIDSDKTRVAALQAILKQEQQRMKRIQANKAQYAELTRGMEVNKQIYDDLLKKRETARVSMRLDLDGQGLNYHIQQSAQYPLAPVGPNFPLFASAGLLLGLIAPFGLAAALVQVDPRIRDKNMVEEELEVPVLSVIPEVRTPFERRRDRQRTWQVAGIAVLVVAGYAAIATLHLVGVV